MATFPVVDHLSSFAEFGTALVVVKGRKVPVGTEGEVSWLGHDNYAGKPRVGIRDVDGKVHFTALTNCKLISEQ